MRKKGVLCVSLLLLAIFISACQKESDAPPITIPNSILGAFQPLPANFYHGNTPSQTLIDLGKVLYYEPRLSKNHDISCNSCHQLDNFGVDGEITSLGHKKQRGERNSPSVYNAAGHLAQFWDGREPDVEAQAKGPILNPVEMAVKSDLDVVKVLKSIPDYQKYFAEAFPGQTEPITYDNLAIAIGAFERNLVTPSRWDEFLKGDKSALTNKEKQGLLTFVQSGCTTCHNGALVGGGMYMKLGLVKPWENQKDLGRYNVTKNEVDKLVFKVPSLRNVTKTAPYFHDGSITSLSEAIRLMGLHQLGKTLNKDEIVNIMAWLNSLTGVPDTKYIAKPKLPENSPSTPKPDPS